MGYRQMIQNAVKDSVDTKNKIVDDTKLVSVIEKITEIIVTAFRDDKKVLLCGNGGSAADAQHLAAELAGKFYFEREPLFAEALHVNSSYLTAVANDYSYDEVYSRLVKAMGRSGDVLIGLSTSGNSLNVIRAMETANRLKLITIGFTGATGGRMASVCQHIIKVPSSDTPRIQEAHIMIGHIICGIVEKEIFGG